MRVSNQSIWLWVKAYAPAVTWAALIFALSSQSTLPGFEESVLNFVFKKSAHIVVYAVLYFLFFRAVTQTTKPTTSPRWGIPLFLCLLYAVTDELHQSLVPGRYPTFRDIGYDMLGASVALLKTMNCI